jgi:GNAT superfamily N-acetyltransferase
VNEPSVTYARVDRGSLPAAIALLGEQFAEHGIALAPSAIASAARGMVDDPSRGALILATSPSPIGIAALAYTWTLEHGGLVAWLDELYVIPAERGRGIGTTLLHHAVDVARAAGALALELEVDTGHARAERLYVREGFSRLPRARWSLPLERA